MTGRRLPRIPVQVNGLLVALGLAWPEVASAQTPDEMMCDMASQVAAQANAAGPTPIDASTMQERVDVNSETKTILTHFSRKDTAASQPAGWEEMWQQKLSMIYRGDPATHEVITAGWTLAESTTFADGVVFEIKAVCE